MNFSAYDRIWFLTWTTYGTWLPGDERGFVSPKFDGTVPERRHNALGTEYDAGRRRLRELAMANLVGPPIWLTAEHAGVLRKQFEETAHYRGWVILAAAIMPNHVHILTGVWGDPDPEDLMRDYKSYGSRALNREFGRRESGTWWTEQGSKRKARNQRHLEVLIRYIRKQPNAFLIWELAPRAPGCPGS
jgi:REP element-mobilizing transposase RayT